MIARESVRQGCKMDSLNPQWLSVELAAMEKEDAEWSSVHRDAYEAAVQDAINRKSASDYPSSDEAD